MRRYEYGSVTSRPFGTTDQPTDRRALTTHKRKKGHFHLCTLPTTRKRTVDYTSCSRRRQSWGRSHTWGWWSRAVLAPRLVESSTFKYIHSNKVYNNKSDHFAFNKTIESNRLMCYFSPLSIPFKARILKILWIGLNLFILHLSLTKRCNFNR